jgi:hypothetical protein
MSQFHHLLSVYRRGATGARGMPCIRAPVIVLVAQRCYHRGAM